jgi:hypothetical protein
MTQNSPNIPESANKRTGLSREMGLLGLAATGICSMVGAGITVIPFMIQRNVPGYEYGSDKIRVANAMSNRNATMVLFNSSQASREAMSGLRRHVADLKMHSMWANEIAAEGSDDYMNHITRDAIYEEVWHLVHDTGIIPTMPKFQSEIEAAIDAAVKIGWGPPNDNPSSWHSEYYAQQYDN